MVAEDTKFYLDEKHVNLMPEPKGFWVWPDCRSQPVWVDVTNSKRGVFIMGKHHDPLSAGIALLKKIQRNALPPDSQSLYDKGMEEIEKANELLNLGVDELVSEDEATDPAESEEGATGALGEEDESPEPETLAPEGAASTVDDQMEGDLEEATKKALEEKPE